MIYFNAFIFSGLICALGQIVLDNTKLTAGHITSLFTVLGAILSFLGIYPKIIKWCGAGATILIMNFGNSLFIGGMEGYQELGLLGIFSGLLTRAGLAIVAAIVFAFVFALLFRSKD